MMIPPMDPAKKIKIANNLVSTKEGAINPIKPARIKVKNKALSYTQLTQGSSFRPY